MSQLLTEEKRNQYIEDLLSISQPGDDLKSVKGGIDSHSYTIGMTDFGERLIYITELFGNSDDGRITLPGVSMRRVYIGDEKGLQDVRLEDMSKDKKVFFSRNLADYTFPVQESMKEEFDKALLKLKNQYM